MPPRNRPARGALRTSSSATIWVGLFLAALVIGTFSVTGRPLPPLSLPEIGRTAEADLSFAICSTFRRDNCVIDGDTFRYGGERIRIADIDAPETHPARCAYEAELGGEATQRLRQLLSDGPFRMRMQGRDEDSYGRKLRIVTRNGHSLGAMLVREGLAREWTGQRRPWC